jgi:hypothetical protein
LLDHDVRRGGFLTIRQIVLSNAKDGEELAKQSLIVADLLSPDGDVTIGHSIAMILG